MTATLDIRHVEPGDIVETSSRRVGDSGRSGEIVAVLGRDENRYYLVHWENGRESVLYPGEGTTIKPGEPKPGWAD